MTVSQNLSKEMAFEWRSYNEKKPDVQKGSKKTLEIERRQYKHSEVQNSLRYSKKKLKITVVDEWS